LVDLWSAWAVCPCPSGSAGKNPAHSTICATPTSTIMLVGVTICRSLDGDNIARSAGTHKESDPAVQWPNERVLHGSFLKPRGSQTKGHDLEDILVFATPKWRDLLLKHSECLALLDETEPGLQVSRVCADHCRLAGRFAAPRGLGPFRHMHTAACRACPLPTTAIATARGCSCGRPRR